MRCEVWEGGMSCDGRKRGKERDRRRRREGERQGVLLSLQTVYTFSILNIFLSIFYLYLLQIILGVYKIFLTQPSLVDVTIPEVREYRNPVFWLVSAYSANISLIVKAHQPIRLRRFKWVCMCPCISQASTCVHV